ncbi:MAG TPA: hypothetical protein DCQ97_09555, partial [Chitinophagaceae bacterium]|nr:hypothetical protein [Chitinophagaceae bacterium]
MKSWFLFFTILFFIQLPVLKAQVMISESFENGFPPAGWTTLTGVNTNPFELSTTDPTVSGTRCMRQNSNSQYGSDAWIFSAPFPLAAGVNYRISYWYRMLSGGSLMHFKVTLGKKPTILDQSTLLQTYMNVSTTTYTQGVQTFTVTETDNYHFAFNSYGLSSNGRLLIDSVVLEQISGTACSGTPSPVITGPSQICPDSPLVLTNTISPAGGVAYQWQSSLPGANTFSDIAGATTNPFSTTQTTSKDYRCVTTCFYSGQTALSNVLSVTSPAFCYCTPPQSTCTQSHIANVIFGGINNTSGCSATGYADYTSTVTPGAIQAGTSVPIQVTVGSGSTKYVTAWIDYNQNGVFESSEMMLVGNANGTTISTNLAIPGSALGGLTRMRFRLKTSSYPTAPCQNYSPAAGEAEDYAINIIPFTCSGTPVPGTVSGISDICSGVSFTLNLSGSYAGFDLQWESSPLGANTFSPIPGAATTSLTTSQTSSTDYRVKVTCVASGLFAYTNIKSVTTPALCYCVPANTCTSKYISNVTYGSINNSSACTANGDYTASVSPAFIQAGISTSISVTLTGGTTGQVAAWLDLNRNGTFETGEFRLIGTAAGSVVTGSIFIPSNITPGNTRLKVKWNANGALSPSDACSILSSGETEDYTINITAAPVAFYFTSFADTLYDPVINVTTRIVQRDAGLNTTDSLKPRLWARKLGSATWKTFTGQLQSGTANDGYWRFPVNNDSLGVRRNGCDSILFYFVAQDLNTPSNIGYWPETNALHTNVQVQVMPPAELLGYRLKPRLKDTIYVSASDCRYRSMSKANGLFEQINLRKLEGDLTIIIESDIQEDATHELTGAGMNGYRITIRPSGNTLYTISQSASATLIKLNAAKNVTIDGSYNGSGRYLAFTNAGSSPQYTDSISCIEMRNVCDSIVLKNIIFRHTVWLISPPTAGESAVLFRGSGNRNISILNNLFDALPSPTYNMPARHITSFGGNDNVIIRGNEFSNFARAGILALGACQNWMIDSNHFYRTVVPPYTTTDFNAVRIIGGGHSITRNYVGGQAPFCAGSPMHFVDNAAAFMNMIQAVGPGGASPVIISNNRVDNITMGLTVTARPYSFCVINTADVNSTITNNIVGNPQGSTASVVPLASSIFGITAGGTGSAVITNNIVTGIANTAGAGPDYDYVTITGIGKGNSAAGLNIYADSCLVSGNLVYNLRNYNNAYDGSNLETAFTRGISISAGANKLVEKNIIHDLTCNEYSVAGIVYGEGDSASLTSIRQNRIYNLVNTNNFSGYIHGIRIERVRNSLDIINNQVAIANDNLARPVVVSGIHEVSGIGVYPNATKRIIYNSIYLGGAATGTAGSYVYNLTENNTATENRTLFNNIFYNERTGGSTGHFAYRVLSNNLALVLSNTV